MRKRDDSKKSVIVEYINGYYSDYGQTPTVRAISEGTGIAVATVHRYLLALKESGELDYNGRNSITTERIDQEAIHHAAPVLGYVACGEGQEEVEEVIEYVRLPESLVGTGEFFVLIAKGNSMIEAGIHQGDYVVIRKQNTANIGDYVVALCNGLNNLKELAYEDNRYILRSCNSDKDEYPDIRVNNLQVQGVAVCVMHSFIKK